MAKQLSLIEPLDEKVARLQSELSEVLAQIKNTVPTQKPTMNDPNADRVFKEMTGITTNSIPCSNTPTRIYQRHGEVGLRCVIQSTLDIFPEVNVRNWKERMLKNSEDHYVRISRILQEV